MRDLFSRSLLKYVIGIFVIVGITGGILSLIVTNYIVLISVLIIEYIILILILLYIFDKYIKPIEKTTDTVTELVNGNYRARIHHRTNGSVAVLTSQINTLARKLNELSIHEQIQAEQLSTVINNTESGLVLIDEKGYIHLVNSKFISMFGRTSKDYIGYLYYDVLDHEQIHKTVQQTFLYEKHVKNSFTHQIKDKKNYLEIVGAPIFNEKNMLKGAVLVLYDITEFKNLELMRKDFVANVSHELKTPITSIKGFAETLLDGALQDRETLKKFLTIIFEESNRLQLLIEDLLILSRLEQDEFKLSSTLVNIDNILKEIIPIINFQAEEKQITFNVEAQDSIKLTADYKKLKQVFINLLTNAISYTPNHGEVTLKIDEKDNCIRIKVIDTGIGIDTRIVPRIFERFYRVDKDRSRNTGGTGLGLAIVKHIIELHHGKIKVDSELNKGSTFTVYLPKE